MKWEDACSKMRREGIEINQGQRLQGELRDFIDKTRFIFTVQG